MSTFLTPHLQQISLASASIRNKPFPQPKMFTNALLKSTDIVTLIRDTDAHERALFTVSSAPQPKAPPRRNTAAFSVLGGDMVESLRRGGAGTGAAVAGGGGGGGEVDVEVLLEGVERLLAVYPLPGARPRIHAARSRFEQLSESLLNYEALVEAQREQLEILHSSGYDQPEDIAELCKREEEEIEELEKRKRELEERIRGLEKELGGV